MIGKWIRQLFWRPFELFCRSFPLIPFKTTVSTLTDSVAVIRTNNSVTKLISKFGGGYDYSVSYLIDNKLLIDTGFPWAMRSLNKTLKKLGADKSIEYVINTHSHEDHVGNNDLLAKISKAEIFAHPLAISSIKHPEHLPWYRNFMFGPVTAGIVKKVPDRISFANYEFEIHHTPGHSPDHICIFEKNNKWLFSGDLYISAEIDSQLKEVDGNAWIDSLERMKALNPRWMFDAHGVVIQGEKEISALLSKKLSFLVSLREQIKKMADETMTIREITAKIFNKRNIVNNLSFNDGWLSLLTASDFSRSNIVRSFLKNQA